MLSLLGGALPELIHRFLFCDKHIRFYVFDFEMRENYAIIKKIKKNIKLKCRSKGSNKFCFKDSIATKDLIFI